ncbi:hypothetical protein KBC99_01395 [Candidatus Saccharibacteria bacterium]|nr:hypothetical protein [Candidatus Saccharibacteria bacterium]
MNNRQTINKSKALLEQISRRDVTSESALLTDKALLELFSWGTDRPPRARLKDTLAVLVRQGNLTLGTIGGEKLYKISSKGRQSLILTHLRASITTSPASQWRERWYFVTYQIPDSNKVARNQFLTELKRIGFLRYGTALWIYPHDVSVQIKKIAAHLHIDPYIDILRADTIAQPTRWKKKFKLG